MKTGTSVVTAIVAAVAVTAGALVLADRAPEAPETGGAADAAVEVVAEGQDAGEGRGEETATPTPTPVARGAVAAPVPDNWDYSTVIGYTGADDEVHLTFDDGPDKDTPRILDILDRYGVKATFCMTGQQVDAHPDIAREVVQRGHLTCNHSYAHQTSVNRGSVEGVAAELAKTNDAFERAGIGAPSYYRAPEGVFTPQVAAALPELGMRSLGWSVDSKDWTMPGVSAIVSGVLDNVGPKAIVLMHDGGGKTREQTVQALPQVIDGIRKAGYTLATPP